MSSNFILTEAELSGDDSGDEEGSEGTAGSLRDFIVDEEEEEEDQRPRKLRRKTRDANLGPLLEEAP